MSGGRAAVIAGAAFLGLVVVAALIANALHREFNNDEIEHVHSSWYLLQGAVPFRDYYQNHNPGLWFLLAPLLSVVGERTTMLFAGRALMVLFTLASLFLLGRLAFEVFRSRFAALCAPLLVASVGTFASTGIEIRPDVPMWFFEVASLLALVRALASRSVRSAAISGLLWGIAFVFLQKVVFAAPAYALVLGLSVRRKELRPRAVFVFAAGAAAPVLLLLLYLAGVDALDEYWRNTVRVNLGHTPRFPRWTYAWKTLREDPLFWLAGVMGIAATLRGRVELPRLLLASAALVVLAAVLLVVPLPYAQYYLPVVALFGTGAALLLAELRKRSASLGLVVSALLLVQVSLSVTRASWRPVPRQSEQLELLEYVLERTAPDEPVFDGDNVFNLFRPDVHYMWQGLRRHRGLDTLRSVSGGAIDYDPCALISEKRPRFIAPPILSRYLCHVQRYRLVLDRRLFERIDKDPAIDR
jgi:hypothetical protein